MLGGRLQLSNFGNGAHGFGVGTNEVRLSGGAINSVNGFGVANPIVVIADSEITATGGGSINPLHLQNITVLDGAKLTFRNAATTGSGEFQPRLFSTGANFTPGPIEIANGDFGTTVLYSNNTFSTIQMFDHEISGTGGFAR